MLSRRIPICQTMVALLASASIAATALAEAKKAPARAPASGVARIVSVNGNATVGGRALEAGEVLSVGDVIQTPEDGGVKLLLPDESIVDIGPSSLFRIEDFRANSGADREVVVGVDAGRVRASIRKKIEGRGKFHIRTRASVLAVRGTELAVEVGGSGSESVESTWVREGTVSAELGGGAPVSVPQGRYLETRGRREGDHWVVRASDVRVSPLSASELDGVFRRATVLDRGFLQHVVIGRDPHLRGRETYQILSALFPGPPPLGNEFRQDPSSLLHDTTPHRRDDTLTLRRVGVDQSIDIGGTNVTDVDVTVIFHP